jgi:phosphohistidine phosphatase
MAKHLYLIRHGNAPFQWNDFERQLDAQGKNEATLVGEYFAKNNINIDHVFSSDAPRAVLTADLIAEQIAFPKESITVSNEIYETTAQNLLNFICFNAREEFESVIMINHNPTISHLANLLLQEDRVFMKTCQVVHIKFEVDTWLEISL